MQLLNREMQKVFHQQRVLMDLITIFFASAMLAFFVSKCDGRTLEFMLGEWWQMIIHQCFYTVNILIKIVKKIRWKIITLFKLKNNTLKTLVQKKKDERERCCSLFLNKVNLLYACLDTKLILWSRQRGTFKLANPKHEPRTARQSLVDFQS